MLTEKSGHTAHYFGIFQLRANTVSRQVIARQVPTNFSEFQRISANFSEVNQKKRRPGNFSSTLLNLISASQSDFKIKVEWARTRAQKLAILFQPEM